MSGVNFPSAKSNNSVQETIEGWKNKFFDTSLAKSHLKPHTFFEGYGSIVDTFAANESGKVKTWSRIVVEHFLQKFECYFPRKKFQDDPNPPSLAKAWAYYEHVTLPRRYVSEHHADTVLHRAEPGEDEEATELYNPFFTPQSALIEWGTGVDLYFMSLRFFAVVLFIAGLINISSMNYYRSESYNANDEQDIDWVLKGSAVCTNTAWVVCEDCTSEQWKADKGRFGQSEDGTILVLRNLCRGATTVNGTASFITLMFLLVAFSVFSLYLRQREIRFDEDKVTSTDYSILVKNPPPGSTDPDEWRAFFEQFTPGDDQVTVVTIALNNEELLAKLIKRRVLRRKLRLKLRDDSILDDEAALVREIERFKAEEAQEKKGFLAKTIGGVFNPSPEKLWVKIKKLTEEIKELQTKKYEVSKVFVTFETERGQRAALKALSVGRLHLYRNNKASLASERHAFRGKVLKVREPCEPNAVRWLDLSAGRLKRFKGRLFTFALTMSLLLGASVGITKARSEYGPSLSGPLTALSNVIIPNVIKLIMVFETHPTEGSYQTSLYLKVTLFRWTLSAILAQIITPFTSALATEKTDLLPTISHILIADVWLVPMLKLLNIGGNIKKHILGPRKRTQEEMNMCFQGSHYNLGERYTDMTKVLFMVFFYSSLFPAGFFFGALILTIQQFVDKFSLMRLWGWSPLIGSELAVFSRQYFFTLALMTLALVSSYSWAQFPYDNVCDSDTLQRSLNGNYTGVSDLHGKLVDGNGLVEVTQSSSVVFCDQSWRTSIGIALPSLPRLEFENGTWRTWVEEENFPWMTSAQVWLTTIYGWVAMIVVLIFVISLFLQFFRGVVLSFFKNTYEPDGDSQNIDFSSDPDVFAYVPQVKVKGFPFPFIACDIDKIDHGLIGWEDRHHNRDYHNLLFDVPWDGLHREKSKGDDPESNVELFQSSLADALNTEVPSRPTYSIVKHFPTKWQLNLAKKNR